MPIVLNVPSKRTKRSSEMTEKEEPEVAELLIEFKSKSLGYFKLRVKGEISLETKEAE